MLTMTMKRLQMNLKYLGFYLGQVDGVKGNLTKSAIKEYRKTKGLGESDIADQKMIDTIRAEIEAEQKRLGVTVDGVAGQETINARNNNAQLSWDNLPHFKQSEFSCKCGCGFKNIDLGLVKILEEIREHFGNKPVIVTSGCRCSNHNANVGGVQGSRHVLGKASDIYINGVTANELLKFTQSLVNQGKLRYTYTNNSNMSGVVHVDVK